MVFSEILGTYSFLLTLFTEFKRTNSALFLFLLKNEVVLVSKTTENASLPKKHELSVWPTLTPYQVFVCELWLMDFVWHFVTPTSVRLWGFPPFFESRRCYDGFLMSNFALSARDERRSPLAALMVKSLIARFLSKFFCVLLIMGLHHNLSSQSSLFRILSWSYLWLICVILDHFYMFV